MRATVQFFACRKFMTHLHIMKYLSLVLSVLFKMSSRGYFLFSQTEGNQVIQRNIIHRIQNLVSEIPAIKIIITEQAGYSQVQ